MARLGRVLGTVASTLAVSLLCAGTVLGSPDKAVGAGTQDACEKQAGEAFRKEFGTGVITTSEAQSISTFSSHFNGKSGKCFVLRTTTTTPHKAKEKGPSTLSSLYALGEVKEYATFFKFARQDRPVDCRVQGQACKSRQEWESLVRPFMEE